MAKPNVISKNDLIKSAKECIVDQGIENFTLRSVAEKAKVTQGTIYYHFRAKEQLLLGVVQNICEQSWNEISSKDEFVIKQALQSAKSRCSYDSFFHKLFFSLVASSFQNDKIREQLGSLLLAENEALYKNLSNLWSTSPFKGVELETWGVFFNAMIDGIALQALLQKDFPIDTVFEQLEQFINGLHSLHMREK